MATTSSWTDLGDGIRVRQSAAFQMNSTFLAHREHAVLVDPGVLPNELDDIARVVQDAHGAALTLVFTHAHWDHVIGRPWWPTAATLAHDHFANEAKRDAARILDEIRALATQHGQTWERGFTPFRPDQAVSGQRFLKIGPWRLVLRDAFGHSSSQLSIHLPDRGVLIAADMLSDIELPLLAGPCAPYLETLHALLPLAEGGAITTLIPGHGSIARGREACLARLRDDIHYLERLDAGVAQAQRETLTPEAARSRLKSLTLPSRGGGAANPAEHSKNVDYALGGPAGPAPQTS